MNLAHTMTPLSINPPTDPLTPQTVADLARDCHADSVSKGWWEPLDTPTQEAAREAMRADLIGSEVGEALDALRRPERPLAYLDDKGKPDGYLVEVADVAIRALDLLGYIASEMAPVNVYTAIPKTREHNIRPHAKWHHMVWFFLLQLSNYEGDIRTIRLLASIVYLCEVEAIKHKVDLLHLIQIKRDFNRTRPTRHGGMSV